MDRGRDVWHWPDTCHGVPVCRGSRICESLQETSPAVDIPSGLDCDTGEPLGPTIRATHTATFVALKKGFLNQPSRGWGSPHSRHWRPKAVR